MQRSTHVGWTGMPSKRKLAPVVTRDGINGTRGQPKDQDVAVLEIDSTFGRVLGLSDGQKVYTYPVFLFIIGAIRVSIDVHP